MHRFLIFLILTVTILLSACTRPANIRATLPPQTTPAETASPTPAAPADTPTPPATATFLPTTQPKTATPEPGTPPATPTTPLPADPPLKTWQNLPVMPDAITGEELPDRYRFMVTASVEDVRSFYKTELPKLGYEFSADGTGENGAPISIFNKAGNFLSVSMIVLGDLVVVTLAPI